MTHKRRPPPRPVRRRPPVALPSLGPRPSRYTRSHIAAENGVPTVDVLVPVRVEGAVPGVRRGRVEAIVVSITAPTADTVPGRTGYTYLQKHTDGPKGTNIEEEHYVDADGATYRSETLVGPGVDPAVASSRLGGVVVPTHVSGRSDKAFWMARHPADYWTVVEGPVPPEVDGHVRALRERGLRTVKGRVSVRAERPRVVIVGGDLENLSMRLYRSTPGDPVDDTVAPWRVRPLQEVDALRNGEGALDPVDATALAGVRLCRLPPPPPPLAEVDRLVSMCVDPSAFGRWVSDPGTLSDVADLVGRGRPMDDAAAFADAVVPILSASDDVEARILGAALSTAVTRVPEVERTPEPYGEPYTGIPTGIAA